MNVRVPHAVSFFNNKGGVGKTTLLCNVAAYIAEHTKTKIALVDADPQCNATQLVVDEQRMDRLYTHAPEKESSTIQDILRPLTRGEPSINKKFSLIDGATTRFTFDLLPGHPRLALLEDRLSQSWTTFAAGDFAGARQTNWCTQLIRALGKKYDLIFVDVGPSLGALNRSVLIGTDFFVTPMGCDIFSIAGIENIATWLTEWSKRYTRAVDECQSRGVEVDEFRQNSVRLNLENASRFVGFTVQQYVAKSEGKGGGQRRPTWQFERIRKRIPLAMHKNLQFFLADHLDSGDMELGDVPNMYSLVPMAQSGHTPIHRLQGSDGLVGAQYSQRDNYAEFVGSLAESLLRNLGTNK
ncbi:ParA family protein [Sorangium sp. So ce1128]